MSEGIDLVFSDSGADKVAQDLTKVATSADTAAAAVDRVNNVLKGTGDVARNAETGTKSLGSALDAEATEAARAQGATQKLRDSLGRFSSTGKEAAGAAGSLGGALPKIPDGAAPATSSIDELTKQLQKNVLALTAEWQALQNPAYKQLSDQAKRLKTDIADMQNTAGGSGGFSWTDLASKVFVFKAALESAASAVSGIFEAAKDYDMLNNRLKGVEGSSQGAAEAMRRLTEAAKLPGLGLEQAAQAYASLRGLKETGNDAISIINAMARANAAMGGGAESFSRIMNQIQQMVGKGKLMSEDIMQVSESLPNFRAMMLQAFGTTSGEAISAKMSVDEFLKGIVNVANDLPSSADSIANNVDNIKDSWKQFKASLIDSQFLKDVTGGIAGVADSLANLSKEQAHYQLVQGNSGGDYKTRVKAGLSALVNPWGAAADEQYKQQQFEWAKRSSEDNGTAAQETSQSQQLTSQQSYLTEKAQQQEKADLAAKVAATKAAEEALKLAKKHHAEMLAAEKQYLNELAAARKAITEQGMTAQEKQVNEVLEKYKKLQGLAAKSGHGSDTNMLNQMQTNAIVGVYDASDKAKAASDRAALAALALQLDTTRAKWKEYNDATDLVNRMTSSGAITFARQAELITALNEKYKDLTKTAADSIDALQRQLDAATKLTVADQSQQQAIAAIKQLREQGVTVTDEEASKIRVLTAEVEAETAAQQRRTALLQQAKAAQQDYSQSISDMYDLVGGGAVSIDQAHDLLVSQNSDILANTQEANQLELESYQSKMERIKELEAAGVISAESANQARLAQSANLYSLQLSQADSFFGNLASLSASSNSKLAAIGKAAAITQATIDGVLAVQKALASSTPPTSYALAAAVAVKTAMNVATIASQSTAGYAFGGDFTVQGTGGTDSQLVAFRATPGETVSVRTPTQNGAAAASSGGGSTMNARIVNVVDKSLVQDYLSTSEGEKMIVNVIKSNSDAVKALVS